MSNSEELKQTAVSDSEQITTLKQEEKEKLAAAEEAYSKKRTVNGDLVEAEQADSRQVRGHGRSKTPWVPGVILIGLGLLFLLNNTTSYAIDNWWALFILIPAIGSFSKAAEIIRSEGEFNRQAWGALASGTILTLVASTFLFNLSWGLIWPIFLIIGGLGLFLGAVRSW
jgi:hypothetical protein